MCKVVSTVPKSRFETFGVAIPQDWDVTFLDYPATEEQMISACDGADFLFVGSVHEVSANVIQNAKSLRMLHVEGVGFNKVDVDAAKEVGLPVCNNRACNNAAVAEHTVGLILSALRKLPLGNTELMSKDYIEVQSRFRRQGIHELSAQHVGLIGIGAIGREVARMLAPFKCKISYYDAFRPTEEQEKEMGVSYLSVEELIASCDVISMHVPVLPSTVGMIGKEQFAAMKEDTLLVNTSRGEVIDQDAMIEALESGKIYAALDTFTPEPPGDNHPLLNMSQEATDRLIVSPHIGGTTVEAFTRMLKWAINDMQLVLDGKMPNNIVNGVDKMRSV